MKKTVKALAVLLALCIGFSALVVIAGAAASDVAEQGTFAFGMYPQTRETDKAKIEKLNDARETSGKAVVVLDGVTYASYRVSETGCKPGGSPFCYYYKYFPYMEKYGLETYWFRFEPIQWSVLDSGTDGVLLIAENVLCTHTFNDTVKADNTWATSDVRAWLNDTFLKDAFTAKERAFLQSSELTNEPNLILGTSSGSGTTTDKIFLPSQNEITNPDYGFNVGWKDKVDDFGRPIGYYETDTEPGEHSARSTGATDFAKCLSAWTHLDKETNQPMPTCFYWLRTAGESTSHASGVLPDGRVSMTGWPVDYTVLGIRPMMRVAANAVAEGKVSEAVDAFNPDGSEPSGGDNDQPFHITPATTEFHYKQEDVKLTADTDVTWTSSNPRIAEIDPETGELTIHRVGTVIITATSKETGETVTFEMEITYEWWQMLIRIFLFGWAWY